LQEGVPEIDTDLLSLDSLLSVAFSSNDFRRKVRSKETMLTFSLITQQTKMAINRAHFSDDGHTQVLYEIIKTLIVHLSENLIPGHRQ